MIPCKNWSSSCLTPLAGHVNMQMVHIQLKFKCCKLAVFNLKMQLQTRALAAIMQAINQSINQTSNHLNHNLCTDHINQLHALVGLPSRLWTTAPGSFHADGLSPSPVTFALVKLIEYNFLGSKGIPKITKLLNWFCPSVNRNMCANNSRANKNHGNVALDWFSLRSFFKYYCTLFGRSV